MILVKVIRIWFSYRLIIRIRFHVVIVIYFCDIFLLGVSGSRYTELGSLWVVGSYLRLEIKYIVLLVVVVSLGYTFGFILYALIIGFE